jgi:hypothetical protein
VVSRSHQVGHFAIFFCRRSDIADFPPD